MDKLTDFTDTSDVSDAAIEWVLQATGSPAFSAESIRSDARLGGGYPADCARMLAARLIQRHRSDLLVDPVDKIVREELAKASEEIGMPGTAKGYRNGRGDETSVFTAAKRLYLMGIEKGKQS